MEASQPKTSKLVKIEVTQEDIDQGKKQDCHFCPVALAMSRALGDDVWVGNRYWRLDGDPGRGKQLPLEAKKFIVDFDDRKPVSPLFFEVEA